MTPSFALQHLPNPKTWRKAQAGRTSALIHAPKVYYTLDYTSQRFLIPIIESDHRVIGDDAASSGKKVKNWQVLLGWSVAAMQVALPASSGNTFRCHGL